MLIRNSIFNPNEVVWLVVFRYVSKLSWLHDDGDNWLIDNLASIFSSVSFISVVDNLAKKISSLSPISKVRSSDKNVS